MMTKEETIKIIQILHANQPAFREDGNTVNLWFRHFADQPYVNVIKAVDKFIENNVENYPVSVAKIKAWLPNKKPRTTAAGTRAYNIKHDGEKATIEKIKYTVCEIGGHEADAVIDEDGYIYSCPDPVDNALLVSRVRSTGMIVSEEVADKEYAMLVSKLEGRSGK